MDAPLRSLGSGSRVGVNLAAWPSGHGGLPGAGPSPACSGYLAVWAVAATWIIAWSGPFAAAPCLCPDRGSSIVLHRGLPLFWGPRSCLCSCWSWAPKGWRVHRPVPRPLPLEGSPKEVVYCHMSRLVHLRPLPARDPQTLSIWPRSAPSAVAVGERGCTELNSPEWSSPASDASSAAEDSTPRRPTRRRLEL